MSELEAEAVDGRRARRERGRVAVMDAMVDLVQEGHGPPATKAIADRAGVSTSSLFRYFDSLDELREETTKRFFERYDHLFEVPALGEGSLGERVERYAGARVRLYETIAPVSRLARVRQVENPQFAANLSVVRHGQADQARAHFAPEVRRLGTAEGEELVALISTLTSFEAWDLLREELGRTGEEVHRAWARGLHALCAERSGSDGGDQRQAG